MTTPHRTIFASLSVLLLSTGLSSAQFNVTNNNNNNNANTSSSSQGLDRLAAHELDPTAPDMEFLTVPQNTTDFAIRALARPEITTAGVPMTQVQTDNKDVKQMAPVPESSWFSDPESYSDYEYAHVQDTLPAPLGLDGDKHSGTVGFDFVTFFKTVVGFNFTYTNEDLNASSPSFSSPGTTGIPTSTYNNSSNSYFFSTYAAKNFDSWVNVGTSFTYGRTDTDYRSDSPASTLTFPGFAGGPGFTTTTPASFFGQSTREDSYALAPFVGLAHTWGAYSFSSTPTYIWDYNHYEFATPVVPGGGAAAIPSTRTINSTFLWLNSAQYAVTDKVKVSLLGNWTRHVSTAVLTTPGSTPISHGWVTVGARADYSFNKDGNVYAQFDHDIFSDNTDDWRIRSGVSYQF